MTWDVIIRVLNSIGCLIALWYLSTAAYRQWTTWNDKTQEHWWALTGWVFIGFEGALENLILGTTPGPRVILQLLVVAFTLRALTRPGELRSESVTPWKKDET